VNRVTNLSWAESYLGQLRALAGDQSTLLLVGAKGIIRDETGRVLLIRRADSGYWSIPGGAMELGESVADCAIREVFEEIGVRAGHATPFAMYTGPQYTLTNVYGHTYQLFVVGFLLTEWTGEVVPDPDEATDAGFYHPDTFPSPMGSVVHETLADLASFEATGRLVAK
jgi:ADP-ribose pyrophosphatase YjhB (NUDIX family)